MEEGDRKGKGGKRGKGESEIRWHLESLKK